MRKRLALLTLMLPVSLALVWAMEDQRAEFHQTYQLTANGRVAVHNVNGAIQVSAWDRNEVKVDAIKHGRSQQELDEARIVVEATAGSVEIRTKYPDGNHNNHASIEYTITVPRGASLEPVESVNGAVSIDGVAGRVRASSVNGKIDVRRAEGDTDASTVNGRIDASFGRLSARRVSCRTVNGAIALALPKDAGAHLNANTIHGSISSDFDLPIREAGFGPGSHIETTIGSGGAEIKLETVNGTISLTRP